MKKIRVIIPILTLTVLYSCNDFFSFFVEKDVVLKYQGFKLDQDELGIVYRNAKNAADSVMILEEYKKEWLKRKVLRREAEKVFEVNPNELALKQEVYADNMYAFLLRDYYVESRLDTVVSSEELNERIQDYIFKNSANRNLNDFSFKMRYIVVDQQGGEIDTLFVRFQNLSDRKQYRYVKDYASTNAKSYKLRSRWYTYRQLRSIFPEEIREVILAKAIVRLDDSPVIIEKHDSHYYLLYIDQIRDKSSNNMQISYSQLIRIKNDMIGERREKLIKKFERQIEQKLDSILN